MAGRRQAVRPRAEIHLPQMRPARRRPPAGFSSTADGCTLPRGDGRMKHVEPRLYVDPEAAACKLVEIAALHRRSKTAASISSGSTLRSCSNSRAAAARLVVEARERHVSEADADRPISLKINGRFDPGPAAIYEENRWRDHTAHRRRRFRGQPLRPYCRRLQN